MTKQRYSNIVGVILLLAALGSARYASAQESISTAKEAKTNNVKITGCLGSQGGEYALTDKKGHTFKLTTDEMNLSDHVGHEVAIKGTRSNPESDEITVHDVSLVSSTCKGEGKGANGSTGSTGGPPSGKCPPCDQDEKK